MLSTLARRRNAMSTEQLPLPALGRTSFVCPHCKALAQQQWSDLFAQSRRIDAPVMPLDPEHARTVINSIKDQEEKESLRNFAEAAIAETPSYTEADRQSYPRVQFRNLWTSTCFACGKASIWLRDKVIYPTLSYPIKPNPDLPDEVLTEFNEAAAIFPTSARGAAALLRLAIQRLCNALGKTGDIDTMIAELVADGLSVRVQQALDIVRVIGNESVHPGTIDVRDTPEVASQLFQLVNIIGEKTISEPKSIEALYSTLPAQKLAGISQRNRKALAAPKKQP